MDNISTKSMIEIFKDTLTKNYFNHKGRATRREYWLFYLSYMLIFLIAYFIFFVLLLIAGGTVDTSSENQPSSITFFLMIGAMGALVLFSLATIIPFFCLQVRRLHDISCSGWFILLTLIPLYGGIAVFIMTLINSQIGSNKYGPNPYGIVAITNQNMNNNANNTANINNDNMFHENPSISGNRNDNEIKNEQNNNDHINPNTPNYKV